MLLLTFLIYSFLPLLCFGCMRTPALPGEDPTTVTVDPCPIPPGTAMLFISNEVTLVDLTYGKVDPIQSCATQTGKNNWYNGNTPASTSGSTASAGTWAREMCAAPCICDAAGACYIPVPADNEFPDNPAITFYPHCPNPTTCFIAVILSSDGQLTPVAGGTPFTSDDQFDENNDPRPVTDPQYLRAKSVGCAGCPVVTL